MCRNDPEYATETYQNVPKRVKICQNVRERDKTCQDVLGRATSIPQVCQNVSQRAKNMPGYICHRNVLERAISVPRTCQASARINMLRHARTETCQNMSERARMCPHAPELGKAVPKRAMCRNVREHARERARAAVQRLRRPGVLVAFFDSRSEPSCRPLVSFAHSKKQGCRRTAIYTGKYR